jgi:type II secretory pathway component PulF
MSKRLASETFEEYKARRAKENKISRGTVLVKTAPFNRKDKRRISKAIPSDDAIVLMKVAELSGSELPLSALELLYLTKSNSARKEMIEKFKNTFIETTPMEETV